jgi:hypothetical protein
LGFGTCERAEQAGNIPTIPHRAMKKLLIVLCCIPFALLTGCATSASYDNSEPQDGASMADSGCSS